MPQSTPFGVVQVANPPSNLNVVGQATLFVLGTTGRYSLSGPLLRPGPGTMLTATPRLGMPLLAGRGF